MIKKREFDKDGETMIASELTVEQIYGLLYTDDSDKVKKPTDLLDRMFPDRVPFRAVVLSLGRKPEWFEGLAPSEYDSILTEVEKINPFLQKMLEDLRKIIRELLNQSISKESSAD